MAEQGAKVLKFTQPGYRIEQGIPLPGARRGPKNYPFWDMAPGDSFFLPASTAADRRRVRSSVAGASCVFVKKHAPQTKFSTRYVDGGIRCWRTK